MSHTKEPWKVYRHADGACVIDNADGETVNLKSADVLNLIVARVNACAGFETGWLEGLVKGGSTLEKDIDAITRSKSKAEQKHAELLAALKKYGNHKGTCDFWLQFIDETNGNCTCEFEQAIASVENNT